MNIVLYVFVAQYKTLSKANFDALLPEQASNATLKMAMFLSDAIMHQYIRNSKENEKAFCTASGGSRNYCLMVKLEDLLNQVNEGAAINQGSQIYSGVKSEPLSDNLNSFCNLQAIAANDNDIPVDTPMRCMLVGRTAKNSAITPFWFGFFEELPMGLI